MRSVHNIENGVLNIEIDRNEMLISNSGQNTDLSGQDIFERYKKLSKSDGTFGLGLSLAKNICDLYNLKLVYITWTVFTPSGFPLRVNSLKCHYTSNLNFKSVLFFHGTSMASGRKISLHDRPNPVDAGDIDPKYRFPTDLLISLVAE